MRVLFDNNVPAPLRHHLPGHAVSTAREMGWAELGNGELLREGERAGFQVMVTGDKNLSYQQNLAGRIMAIVVLGTTRWSILECSPTALGAIVAAVGRAKPEGFEAIPMNPPPRLRS